MPKPNVYDILVIGAGIFGVTTALELRARGYQVALLDPGPLPHPFPRRR
jgi:sarcosine oxidase / L-pipecolate oxidase